MKRLSLILFCLLMWSCKNLTGPTTTTSTTTSIPLAANIVIDGTLSRNMTTYGCPVFEGFVKNIGNRTGYNCMIRIICYSESAKTNIIDTALGFPANLGDIAPGARFYFDAVCFRLTSHSQIVAFDTEITWLNR